jgi:hypothetical protein
VQVRVDAEETDGARRGFLRLQRGPWGEDKAVEGARVGGRLLDAGVAAAGGGMGVAWLIGRAE